MTQKYGGRKLLINKQFVKVGADDIPNFSNLKAAITKKEGISKFLADLNKIRKEYAQDDVENPSTEIRLPLSDTARQEENAENRYSERTDEQHNALETLAAIRHDYQVLFTKRETAMLFSLQNEQ